MSITPTWIFVILLALAVYFLVPGVRPFLESNYADYKHQKEVTHLRYLESQGKITISVPEAEL